MARDQNGPIKLVAYCVLLVLGGGAHAQDVSRDAEASSLLRPNPLGVLDTSKFNSKGPAGPAPEFLKRPVPDNTDKTDPETTSSSAVPTNPAPEPGSEAPAARTEPSTSASSAAPAHSPPPASVTTDAPTANPPSETAGVAPRLDKPAEISDPATAAAVPEPVPATIAPAPETSVALPEREAPPPSPTPTPPPAATLEEPASRSGPSSAKPEWSPPPTERPMPAEQAQRFRDMARAAIGVGDIVAARALLDRLAAHRDAEAAFLLAQTYDQTKLSQWGVIGLGGDAGRASDLYRQAHDAGYLEPAVRGVTLP